MQGPFRQVPLTSPQYEHDWVIVNTAQFLETIQWCSTGNGYPVRDDPDKRKS